MRFRFAVVFLALVVAGATVSCSGTPIVRSTAGTSPSGPSATPANARRDVASMSADQRRRYIDAVVKLQHTPAPDDPSMTWYEQFVAWHRQAFSCDLARGPVGAAHNSPLFLPWHREFLLRYEAALRSVSHDETIFQPYWDWTSEASTKAVFSDDFMGGEGDPAQGYAVTTGPFAKGSYELRVLDPPAIQDEIGQQTNYLVRRFGSFNGNPQALPAAAQVEAAMGVPAYDAAPWSATVDGIDSFRNAIEGWRQTESTACTDGWQDVSQVSGSPHEMHNGVHVWVGGRWKDDAGAAHGGSMLYNTSPNDPVFFLHHTNLDRLYAQWQQRHTPQFPADAAGYQPTDTMWPWNDRSIESLEDTEALGYRYP